MRQWLQTLTSRLRFKVLCTALIVTLITGAGGWISLKYSNSATASVTNTTELYLPLLTNAVNASNAMRHLTGSAHDLLQACAAGDGSHHELLSDSLNQDFTVIKKLENMLIGLDNPEYLLKVRSARDQLEHAFKNLSDSCDIQASLQLEFTAQQSRALTAIGRLNRVIDDIGTDYIRTMPPPADVGSGKSEPNRAAAEVWRERQLLELMSVRLKQIHNGLRQSHSNTLIGSGNGITRQSLTELTALAADHAGLAPLLNGNGQGLQNERMAEGLTQLTEAFLGPSGIHDIWRRTKLFYSGTATTRMALNRSDIALASTLRAMEEEARTRYRQALAETRATLDKAHWAAVGVTAVIAVMLIVSGLMLAAGLIRPIESLKGFVLKLRTSNELSQQMPTQLLGRQDEVGALAQSFNDLIADLSIARQHLLAESKAKIRVQYERLSAAIESIPQGLCLFDADNRLLLHNSRLLDLYDLEPHDLWEGVPLQKVLDILIANGARPLGHDGADQNGDYDLVITDRPQLVDFRHQRTLQVRSAPTPEGGLVLVHEDITQQQEKDRALRELGTRREIELEEERKRIAREVHDELGQILTALRLDINMLRSRFGADNPQLLERTNGMMQLVDRTIRVVRDVATALRPAALNMGIASALEWLTDEFNQRTGILCRLQVNEEEIELDDERAVLVFRVVQESLTNVARHSEADQVDISLRRQGNHYILRVQDNGIGYDADAAKGTNTLGVAGMRERAQMLKGRISLTGVPDQGTTLLLKIPVIHQ